MRIEGQTIENEHAVVMENAYYKSILLPSRAMLPLTFFYKPTGKDLLVRRQDIETDIICQDGIMQCLPWVSSLKPEQSKGLLRTATWKVKTTQEGDCATFSGQAEIAYNDPLSDQPANLRFVQTITGGKGQPSLTMDYKVTNIGKTEARFILVAHPRITAGGAYQKDDYVFAPGTNCWIGDFKWPALAKQGIQPNSWINWPIDDIIRFEPKKGEHAKGEFAYAFVPASWGVIGNNRTKEFIVFHSSPVKIGKQIQATPFFCILHRDGDYLMEIGVSRALGTENWKESWATVSLQPGEDLTFTLTLIPAQGLGEAQIRRAIKVTPERLTMQAEQAGQPVVDFPLISAH